MNLAILRLFDEMWSRLWLAAAPPGIPGSAGIGIQPPDCGFWPGWVCTSSGSASIDLIGAIVGVAMGGFALWQAKNYKDAGDAALAAIHNATQELKGTAEDIAEHIRHRIINIGEAIAYAYQMIHEADEYCLLKRQGEPVEVEVYYINVVCCFGNVHSVNPAVVSHYNAKAEKSGLPRYEDLVKLFPTILQDLADRCSAKVVLLNEAELTTKFFDKLRAQRPYNTPWATEYMDASYKKEMQFRGDMNITSTHYVNYLPFQMLTMRVTRNGETERACSLVLAVGTGSIGKALHGEEESSTQANGYFTQDPHYAEINVEIAKSIWDDASNVRGAAAVH